MKTSRTFKGLLSGAILGLALGFAAPISAESIALLPKPKVQVVHEGQFSFTPQTRIFIPSLERPEWLAVERLLATFDSIGAPRPQLDRPGKAPVVKGHVTLSFVNAPAGGNPDGYRLTISANGIDIQAAEPSGMLYGIETLRQLMLTHGAALPLQDIRDWPDFPRRGFYHDVSRGKVPTVATLQEIIDQLAFYKVNEFQLYIEHPFAFRFDPAIAQNPDGLTPTEILEIQEYCRDRRIDFVPSLQLFGHMAGVLSLPQYRHLADAELKGEWKELTWRDRMSGATINMRDPEALALIEKMHDEYISLFDSGFVNVCADETYDLGTGKNKAAAEAEGKENLYLEHINFLNGLVKSKDKRLMFWGDIVKKHPESIPLIPKDTILLNWGYSAKTDFESTRLFQEAGLDFYVCPGTSGWNRILNNLQNADINIRTYAATGKKYGAIGLLNTDWGDHGHFNALAGSWHGIALGASMAWNTEGPDEATFDRAWSLLTFGNATVAENLKAQSVGSSTWIVMYNSIYDTENLKKYQMTNADAEKLITHGNEGIILYRTILETLPANSLATQQDVEELLLGSEFNILLGEKIQLTNALAEGTDPDIQTRKADWQKRLATIAPRFDVLWLNRNKRAELDDIRVKLQALVEE